VPADGTSAATEGNGDFGTSPIFGQPSDKPAPARNLANWECRTQSAIADRGIKRDTSAGVEARREGFAGHSVMAPLKLFQERGETFRDRLSAGLYPEPCQISRSHGFRAGYRDVRTAPTHVARAGYYRLVRPAGCSPVRSTPEHEVPTFAQNVYETLRDK
jgi:hypothetical protein